MWACWGRKQAGEPCPAPGATVTMRSSRSVMMGASSVNAADNASQRGSVVGVAVTLASATTWVLMVVVSLAVSVGRGWWCSDSGAQGERCDFPAEHCPHDGGDGFAVFFGGYADEVRGGGVQVEN